jgi:hypothetical protein
MMYPLIYSTPFCVYTLFFKEFNTEITSHPQALSLVDLPSKSLHGISLHFQKQGINPIQEVHLCVRSLHRLCLQDIEEDCPLREKMLFMISTLFHYGSPLPFGMW